MLKVLGLPADGYNVVGHTASDLILAPLALASARYEPGQLRLVAPLLSTDFVLVSSPRFSFKGVDDLLAYARQPGNKELSIAHWGRGSTPHIAISLRSSPPTPTPRISCPGADSAIVASCRATVTGCRCASR